MNDDEEMAVHKDFHGALSFGLQFIEDRFGEDGRNDFLAGLAVSVYAPLAEALRRDGLEALRAHWDRIFTLEGGDFDQCIEGDRLTLTVHRCPALAHLQARGYRIAGHFCEHTRLVNEAVCRAAGYACDIEYDQSAARCIQRFWKETT